MKYLALIFALVFSLPAFAANHYICPGATGTHSGAEWTDAYTGIGSATGNINPASMTRGDTYYVANGQVTLAASTTNFSTADSGTSLITIQKATDANNGTSTGWTNGGTGTCNSSQALFGPMDFSSDYWTWTGVHRGNGTGDPEYDWRTNYGFKVINNNGSGVPINTTGAVNIDGGSPNNNTPFSHITYEYTEVAGSGDITASYFDMGIQISGGQSTGNYVGYNYVHDLGLADAIDCDSCNSYTVEYNWVQNNEYDPGNHSEIISMRCWIVGGSETDNGVTIRYNIAENSNSTAMIATPCTTDIHASNWAIYGNIFLYNQSEIQPGYTCNASGTECGNGDGWLSIWNFGTYGFGGYLYVWNNTVSYIDRSGQGVTGQGGACGHDWGGITGATMGNVAVYNTLYYNCLTNIDPICNTGCITYPNANAGCPGTCSSYIDDYNTYYDMTNTNDPFANKQIVTSGNPFVLVGQSANQNNFLLTGASDPTSARFNTTTMCATVASTFGSCSNVDLFGNTYTSSRGALQFNGSGPTVTPAPALGMFAWDWDPLEGIAP